MQDYASYRAFTISLLRFSQLTGATTRTQLSTVDIVGEAFSPQEECFPSADWLP
jgi:hypothetical protein